MRDRIGKFDILKPLGAGAMGEVYLAKDPMIGRAVAIKVIRQDSMLLAGKQDIARERFFREARAAGNLNHPNLVTIHEFGEDEGLLYLAMEFVEGTDLSVLLEEKELRPQEALELLAQVCDGLAHAHGKGVLHRDIKPSNIRVARHDGRPQAKLMDFGIARIGGSDLTGTGTLVGTFSYMAPEYIQGGQASASADLFAVGVILYEALAGRRAFKGDTGATLLYQIVHAQPERLEPERITGISPAIQDLVDRALAKDPRWRFPDAAAFAAALRAAKDPGWAGPGDWQDESTRETAKPLLQAGPPAQPPPLRPRTTQAPIILTRPAEPEGEARPWLWPAAAVAVLAGALGLWALGRPAPAAPSAPTGSAPATPGNAPRPFAGTPEPSPAANPLPAPAESLPAAESPNPGGTALEVPPRPVEPPQPPSGGARREPEGFEAALREIDARPEAALALAEQCLRDEPSHVPSHVLRLSALHRLNRPRDFRAALEEARNAGAAPVRMDLIPHFRRMLDDERRAPILPKDVYAALTEGLSLPQGPPGRRPGG